MATEMWFLRRLLKIPWIEKVLNSEVLAQAGINRELWGIIQRRKIAYLGHIVRGEKYDVLRVILQGRVEGRRPRGRMKYGWIKNIKKEWTGINTYQELMEAARDRTLKAADASS
ncbi:hypothetical protein PGB90_006976 [Kerria lacca]